MVPQKFNFVHDFANNAGRYSKKYQTSHGLTAIAELLVGPPDSYKLKPLSFRWPRLW